MANNTNLTTEDAAAVAAFCEENLILAGATLNDEYFYQSLPLCVIDAVYSIGVRYEGVRNVVRRYCEYFGLQEFREPRDRMPPAGSQQPLSALISKMDELGIVRFTEEVFQNRQRTSSRSGISKSEAVFRFASVLGNDGINLLEDVQPKASDEDLDATLRRIPGQKSGISISYFFMLAGNEDLIKPDRWIIRFLRRCHGQVVTRGDAQVQVCETCQMLQPKYPALTPRLLDNLIWNYERARRD